MPSEPQDLALRYLARHKSLKAERGPWDVFAREVARYMMPDEADIGVTPRNDLPAHDYYDDLFDSTAIRANVILARGQFSQVTPPGQSWFVYQPVPGDRVSERVTSWYQRCSEITRIILANSNFYGEIFKNYIQRGAFGTGCLYIDEGIDSPLYFRTFPFGTYAVAENSEGRIDTVFREFELSARAAFEKFPEGLPAEIVAEATGSDMRKQDRKYCFIHVVEPNTGRDPERADPENKAYRSTYICEKYKKIVRTGGYDSNPYVVSRFMPKAGSPWGWTPSFMALPDARQINYLEMNLDVLAEIAAFPRVLRPASMTGQVNLEPGGQTVFDDFRPNSKPEEWGTSGSYQHGEIRAEHKRIAIEKAFHVDLFNLFSEMDTKNVTARAIAEKANEKIAQFFPMFTLMTSELFNPLLRRAFGILANRGLFPPPPAEAGVSDGRGGFILPDPEIVYTGRIGLMVRRQDNAAFISAMESLFPAIQAKPELLDNFNMDEIAREFARNEGFPERWFNDPRLRDAIRDARNRQMAAAAQLEAQATAADAIGKMKGMTPGEVSGLASLAAA